MRLDEKRIEEEGMRILEKFAEMLEKLDLSGVKPSPYATELKNVLREDREPQRLSSFRERVRKLAPRWEEGYVVAEKGIKE